ncbi:VacJ family lipoprotein [Marinobacter sp. R17]|uniref:MlaA family lipoprotein n=1 Tax=Marinobacter sp. R17 TaxID=2484250 RepID=UPI000F4CF785|nr:VacJ family lipoprotein [Marinobacter sp. R17]ROT98434.1 VacJ family lipoprotein [Marinobacter sp. R17]
MKFLTAFAGARHGRVALVLLTFLAANHALAQQSKGPKDERDPWEGWNRNVYAFNEFIDDWFLRPVAEGYRFITPDFVDKGVTNFFTNLGELNNFVNSVLQLKGESAVVALGRFTYNTTFGLGGLIDVGTAFDLPERPEDLGQTLGYWGVGSGPYLVLPFLGPSTGRDFGGLVGDLTVMPSTWDYIESPENYYMRGLQIVDKRADLIPAESFISGDSYTFVRNAYLQRRQFLINDGKVKSDPFANDDDDVMLDNF